MIKLIKLLVFAFGFTRIVLGPLIVGALIGYFIYNSNTNKTGLVIGIFITVLGFTGGLVWAIHVSRKQNPADYISRYMNSPDMNTNNPDFFHPEQSEQGKG